MYAAIIFVSEYLKNVVGAKNIEGRCKNNCSLYRSMLQPKPRLFLKFKIIIIAATFSHQPDNNNFSFSLKMCTCALCKRDAIKVHAANTLIQIYRSFQN